MRRTTDQRERLIKETLKALNDLVEMKTLFSERFSSLGSQLQESLESIQKDCASTNSHNMAIRHRYLDTEEEDCECNEDEQH